MESERQCRGAFYTVAAGLTTLGRVKSATLLAIIGSNRVIIDAWSEGVQLVHTSAGTQRAEDAIRAAQGSGDTVLVVWGAFCQLGLELGGQAAAMSWLRELVSVTGHPIVFSAPSCDSAAETHVFTPPDWSEERTLGWLGGLHEEAEGIFGSINVLHETPDGSRIRLD